MMFGTLPLDNAEGAILAHSLRSGGVVLKKGRRLSAADVAALRAAGIDSVVGARLEPGDVHEDAAAERIARAVTGAHVSAGAAFTGRVNLFAEARGLVVIDRLRLDRLNLVDEAITIATLPLFAPVEPKQMVATIKIIPFAAPAGAVRLAEIVAAPPEPTDPAGLIRIAPFRSRRIGLIQTRLPQSAAKMLDKTTQVTAERAAALGCTLLPERRCAHDPQALKGEIRALRAQGAELLLIAGASAITDRRDVLPAGITAAGGTIEHFGMPVDPGNLLLLAQIDEIPVLGLPGCARSPKLNGLDWVLQRLVAGLAVGREEIMGMGIGGLLAEIPSRPLPRSHAAPDAFAAAEPPRAPRIAAILLAAGRSQRMGDANKLLADVEGAPMVARVADAVLGSQAGPLVVVTGYQRERIEAVLAGRRLGFVHNPDYPEGLSTSIKAGLAALPPEADGALICLGDMPRVTAAQIDRLIAAYNPAEGRAIVVPVRHGQRGNPVLWDRRFFEPMRQIAGDVGARGLIAAHDELVAEVEMEDEGVLLDIDTPEELQRLAGARAAATEVA